MRVSLAVLLASTILSSAVMAQTGPFGTASAPLTAEELAAIKAEGAERRAAAQAAKERAAKKREEAAAAKRAAEEAEAAKAAAAATPAPAIDPVTTTGEMGDASIPLSGDPAAAAAPAASPTIPAEAAPAIDPAAIPPSEEMPALPEQN
jgi:translation initiation factor IF-2